MSKHSFHEARRQLKGVGMTRAEKDAILYRIMGAPRLGQKVPSPLTIYSFASWIGQHRVLSYAVAVILVISLSTGGVAFAAQGSLPGSILYPIKVDVTEPLQTALTFSAEGKAALSAAQAVERMKEAAALAARGDLNASNQAEIQSLFDQRTAALAGELSSVQKSDPKTAEAIAGNFQNALLSEASALDQIAGTSTVVVPAVATSAASATEQTPRTAASSTEHGRGNVPAATSVPPMASAAHIESNATTSQKEARYSHGKPFEGTNPATSSTPIQTRFQYTEASSSVSETVAPIPASSSQQQESQGLSGVRAYFSDSQSFARSLSDMARHAADQIGHGGDFGGFGNGGGNNQGDQNGGNGPGFGDRGQGGH